MQSLNDPVATQDPYPGIPSDAKETFKSLLRTTPNATAARKCAWAARVGVKSEIAIAYMDHLIASGTVPGMGSHVNIG